MFFTFFQSRNTGINSGRSPRGCAGLDRSEPPRVEVRAPGSAIRRSLDTFGNRTSAPHLLQCWEQSPAGEKTFSPFRPATLMPRRGRFLIALAPYQAGGLYRQVRQDADAFDAEEDEVRRCEKGTSVASALRDQPKRLPSTCALLGAIQEQERKNGEAGPKAPSPPPAIRGFSTNGAGVAGGGTRLVPRIRPMPGHLLFRVHPGPDRLSVVTPRRPLAKPDK